MKDYSHCYYCDGGGGGGVEGAGQVWSAGAVTGEKELQDFTSLRRRLCHVVVVTVRLHQPGLAGGNSNTSSHRKQEHPTLP